MIFQCVSSSSHLQARLPRGPRCPETRPRPGPRPQALPGADTAVSPTPLFPVLWVPLAVCRGLQTPSWGVNEAKFMQRITAVTSYDTDGDVGPSWLQV